MDKILEILYTCKKEDDPGLEALNLKDVVEENHFLLSLPEYVKWAVIALFCIFLLLEFASKFIIYKYCKEAKFSDQPINVLFLTDQVNHFSRTLPQYCR